MPTGGSQRFQAFRLLRNDDAEDSGMVRMGQSLRSTPKVAIRLHGERVLGSGEGFTNLHLAFSSGTESSKSNAGRVNLPHTCILVHVPLDSRHIRVGPEGRG